VMLRTTFAMLRRAFPMLRTVVLATFKEYMLRACCEHVANMVTCNIQHQESFSPPPQYKTQHHTSATSKLNIRNICQITVKH
jgi:hypothetical protein